jgi:very-short-patch-repair endonuclease
VRAALIATMRRQGGVIRRDEALAGFPTYVVDDAVRSGVVVVAHSGVYRLPEADDLATRRLAALAYCTAGALSHTDALQQWGLPSVASDLVHVTVDALSNAASSRSLRIHRRTGFRPEAPWSFEYDGLRVVRIEQAVIESWPLLPVLDRRAPTIVAVRERRTTTQRLAEVLDLQPRTSGAKELRRLFGLLDAGNHSELEIWGHERVFSDRRLPRSKTQLRIVVGDRVVFLDRAFEAELVAVELDGAAYHGSHGQRERDLRRDSALARLGWLTVRFSHQRLHSDPEGVISELLDILERRRAQLAHAS